MKRSGVSPGGVRMSDAKKKTLAALDLRSHKEQRHHGGRGVKAQNNSGDRAPTPGSSSSKAGSISVDLPYSLLDYSVLHGPLACMLEAADTSGISSTAGTIDFVLGRMCNSVQQASNRVGASGTADTRATSNAVMRVQDKNVLLDNPTSQMGSTANTTRGPQFSAHLLPRRKRLKALRGVHSLKDVKYSDVLPLHQLWSAYIAGILSGTQGNPSGNREQEKLLIQADYHGCMVKVKLCRNPAYIDVCGIVAMVSEKAFHVVSPSNRLYVVPFAGTHFVFEVPGGCVELNGSRLQQLASFQRKK